MVARDARAIMRALAGKGFKVHDSHHRKLDLVVNGVKTGISTFISHGTKDYGDSLLASMSRQLHLSKQELLDFIDCRMSGADYLLLLRERGHLS